MGGCRPISPGATAQSITWLECEQAKTCGKEVLTFLVDKDAKWPAELKSHRTAAALEKGEDTPELLAEVKRNILKLSEFKQWADSGRTRVEFTSPEDLRAKVVTALHEWRTQHPECGDGPPPGGCFRLPSTHRPKPTFYSKRGSRRSALFTSFRRRSRPARSKRRR